MYVISGPVAGAGLGLTPVYKCTATICYGADGAGKGNGTDGLFKQVQSVLNRFASPAGFTPIAVDGFIGGGTLSAVKAAAAYIQRTFPEDIAVAGTLNSFTGSKEMLAVSAQSVADLLTREAGKLNLPPPVVYTPPASSGGGGGTFPGTVPAPNFPVDSGTDTGSGGGKSKLPYYIGGMAVAGGLFYLLWTVLDERPKGPSASSSIVAGHGRFSTSRRRGQRARRSKTGFDRRFAYNVRGF